MLINICYRTYSWFLSNSGLLTFKECITWPWYKDRFVSLAKPTTLCNIGKRILCWSIFAKEPIAGFCPSLGYWPSKNESRDHDVTGELVSLAKLIVFATTGKKKFMLANFVINKHCCILIPRRLKLLTSLILPGLNRS